MDLDLAAWALLSLAVIVAGVSKGGFGAGVGFLATPLMALVISPVMAVGVMLPILILMDQIGMATYWRKWRWATVWPAALAAVGGIGLGLLVFGRVPPDALRLGLGVIAILFTAFVFARARGWAPQVSGPRAARAGLCGAAAGFTSAISHAGGPPITIYLLGEKLGKTEYQASSVLLFWVINLVKLGPFVLIGAVTPETLETSATLAPAAVAGVLAGVWLHRRVPERLFLRFMVVALLITGTKLCWDGLSGML